MYFRRLRDLREDANLTQKEVAAYLNISQPQYYLYESGEREIPARMVVSLAKYYKTTTDFILGLTEEK